MSLVIAAAILLVCAAAIYGSCEFFTNGVEWLGRRFNLDDTATGAILAAFGTALPETVVTFVAVAVGANQSSKAIGVGAALGGPLVLSTLGYAVVGATLLAMRRSAPRTGETATSYRRLALDQVWFLSIFAGKIGLGVVTFVGKSWLGWLFLLVYGLYARAGLSGSKGAAESEHHQAPLRLTPGRSVPPLWAILVQTLTALAVVFVASKVFVGQLEAIGPMLGARPQLVALLASPIATELPEIMNAVIWARQGRIGLALANISGAMMIQATVPTALGLWFTPWRLDAALLAAAGATAVATAVLALGFSRGTLSRRLLASTALIYAAFLGAVIGFGL